jgi:hypothetical protein
VLAKYIGQLVTLAVGTVPLDATPESYIRAQREELQKHFRFTQESDADIINKLSGVWADPDQKATGDTEESPSVPRVEGKEEPGDEARGSEASTWDSMVEPEVAYQRSSSRRRPTMLNLFILAKAAAKKKKLTFFCAAISCNCQVSPPEL